jgi:hypothetical protein
LAAVFPQSTASRLSQNIGLSMATFWQDRVDPMPAILLATLNARYFHSSLGLRYLFANLDELQAVAAIREFIISQRPPDIVEALGGSISV